MTAPRPRKTFGEETIDRQLSQLLSDLGDDHNDDLVRSLVVTALDMDAFDVDRLELKIASQSLAEMLNAWRVFSPWDEHPKVTVFGSARTKPDRPDYRLTSDFCGEMTDRGWMTITGAGPGIMQAGIEGAGRENAFGVNIVLPFEQDAVDAIAGDEKLATFRYFFTRKLTFMKETDAFALVPGGFGTLDEAFELLTLVQTGKSYPAPIVLLDHEESTYWKSLLTFIDSELVGGGMVSPADTSLYLHTHSIEEAADYICSFYSCYHSIRFVRNKLIVRLRHALSESALDQLNTEFADLVASGQIEPSEPTKAEIRDDDHLDMSRLALDFDNRSFARLVHMIRRINELAGTAQSGTTSGLVHDFGPHPDDSPNGA